MAPLNNVCFTLDAVKPKKKKAKVDSLSFMHCFNATCDYYITIFINMFYYIIVCHRHPCPVSGGKCFDFWSKAGYVQDSRFQQHQDLVAHEAWCMRSEKHYLLETPTLTFAGGCILWSFWQAFPGVFQFVSRTCCLQPLPSVPPTARPRVLQAPYRRQLIRAINSVGASEAMRCDRREHLSQAR